MVEMTDGVIDLKTCGLTINNTANYALLDNITGRTIRTAFGFIGNRADFTPAGGIFEFYGSSNATISQSNGCTLHDVSIYKSAKGSINDTLKEDDKSMLSEAVFDERSGEVISKVASANMVSLGSDFRLHSLIIGGGTLNVK